MMLWLYEWHLEGLAAYGSHRAERRLQALARLRRRRKVAEWRSWFEAADEIGLDREMVTELVLFDALGDFYVPPEQRLAECSP